MSAATGAVVDEVVGAVPAPSVENSVEANRPAAPTWDGAIAVTATTPSVEATEPVEEVRVATLAPASEVEAIEATNITVPVPPVRPEDVPRVKAPPPAPDKSVTSPKQPKPATKSAPKAATPAPSSNSTRTTAAPAGEQAGSSGQQSAAAGRSLVTSYAGRVASHLQRHKRYPADTKRDDSGTATITFTIGADGRVRGSRLSRSSGVNSFDREVVAMVSRAAPFPPIPPAIGKSSMTFTVPIKFRPR